MHDEMTYRYSPGQREGTMILRLLGPLTLSTIFGFQNEFRAMEPQVLILDLSETPYMDSAGLGLIMNYYVGAEDHGRKFLVAGVNERVKALFVMTKVQGILKSFPIVEDAEASL
jgi:anti-anti-sigma factor